MEKRKNKLEKKRNIFLILISITLVILFFDLIFVSCNNGGKNNGY